MADIADLAAAREFNERLRAMLIEFARQPENRGIWVQHAVRILVWALDREAESPMLVRCPTCGVDQRRRPSGTCRTETCGTVMSTSEVDRG